MVSSSLSVVDAIALYLQDVPMPERVVQQQELNRFLRWCGSDRLFLDRLRPPDIGHYVESVDRSGADQVRRLEPLKHFLVWCKQQGLVETSLAPHVRIRRPSSRKSPAQELRDTPQIELTADGRTQLQQEHDRLVALRPQIADEIGRAMADKDFRENAPLEAARDRQAQIEARIRELQRILKAAKVLTTTTSNARVAVGTTVVLHDLQFNEELRCTIVGPNEADPRRGRVSNVSPLGRALLDKMAGEEVEVTAPAGIQRFRIVSIEVS